MTNAKKADDRDAALAEHAEAIRTIGKRAVDDIIEIGRRLIKAKALCGHGKWLPWLEREFGWTDKTAQRFMSVADKSDKLSNLEVPISGLYMLARRDTPPEVVEAVAERTARGETTKVVDVQRMLKAFAFSEAGPITRSADESGLAALTHVAGGLSRNREAIRRVIDAINDAFAKPYSRSN